LAGNRREKIAQGALRNSLEKLVVEIDIYQGRHAGLVVAEVEFPDRVTCRRFKPLSWFGREVTGEKRYSNVRLANE
jgi:Uncharacterized protein conserved in bacteria